MVCQLVLKETIWLPWNTLQSLGTRQKWKFAPKMRVVEKECLPWAPNLPVAAPHACIRIVERVRCRNVRLQWAKKRFGHWRIKCANPIYPSNSCWIINRCCGERFSHCQALGCTCPMRLQYIFINRKSKKIIANSDLFRSASRTSNECAYPCPMTAIANIMSCDCKVQTMSVLPSCCHNIKRISTDFGFIST